MSGGPAVQPDQRLVVDDVGVVGGAVARDVETLAEIRLGVAVDRRMPHGLAAERQIADIVLADFQRELPLGREGEEARRLREGVLDQFRRDPVIGDDEKPGILAGSRHRAGERGAGPALAGQHRPDVEDRYPAVIRPQRLPPLSAVIAHLPSLPAGIHVGLRGLCRRSASS